MRGKRIVPEENPILMIALQGKDFRKVITWKRFRTELDYIEFVDSESEMISTLIVLESIIVMRHKCYLQEIPCWLNFAIRKEKY